MSIHSETFQLVDQSISALSYYIESRGESIIIDPTRDHRTYINYIKERNTKLKYILMTHIPSDFICGSLDLALFSGAQLIVGPESEINYNNVSVVKLNNNEEIYFGSSKIRAIHTPGHTIESTCYLLLNINDKSHALFTGDTLLISSICGPDLILLRKNTQRELATLYFNSLDILKKLEENIIIYPGHYKGSVSVRNGSKNLESTLKEEKINNKYLNIDSVDEFLQALENVIVDVKFRSYLFTIAKFNINGYEPLTDTLNRVFKPISPEIAHRYVNKGDHIIIDTRNEKNILKSYIKPSYIIPLDDTFTIWAGTLLKENKKLIILSDEKDEETILRLLKIGIYKIEGYIRGGFEKWFKFGLPYTITTLINSDTVLIYIYNREYKLLDVRDKESNEGNLPNTIQMPLLSIDTNLDMIPKNENIYLLSENGHSSLLALSVLNVHGFENVYILENGISNIKNKNIPLI